MKLARISVWALAVCGLLASTAMAQRGVGNNAGVARQTVRPEVVPLTGKVVGVETGPCEDTTGHALAGSHFLMETSDGETLNIHLGPAGAVGFATKELAQGKEVQVEAFRTEAMKKGHYAACTITSGDQKITLRDATLRPVWTGGQRSTGGRGAAANVNSRRAGAGQGRGGNGRGGYGQGGARGYGSAYAGAGGYRYGYGNRSGRGQGYGGGRGQGYGRGRGQGGGYGAATGQCPRFNAGNVTPQPQAE